MSLMPVCELWIPDPQGTALQRAGASYIGYESFAEKSENVAFGMGEGLPGRVWASRRPEILSALDAPSSFVRAQAAVEAELSAGLGLPIIRDDKVVAVLTFLFAQGPEPTGVMEVWGPADDGQTLAWRSGFYGQLDDIKEASMATSFKSGEGLPGRVWASRLPDIIPSLWPSSDFVREEVAAVAGLTTGFAFPIIRGGGVDSVAMLLSSSDMPFAKVMEIWVPDEDGASLRRQKGFYGRHSDFLDPNTDIKFALGEGLPGQVWQSGLPEIIAPLDEESGFARYQAAQSVDLTVAIGIPVVDGSRITAVILLLD